MENNIEKIERVLEYLLAPAGLVNTSGQILFANQALAIMTKLPKSQVQNLKLDSVLRSEGENLEDILNKAHATRTPISSGAFELVTGDASRVILSRFIWVADETLLVSFQDLYRESPRVNALHENSLSVAVDRRDKFAVPPPPTSQMTNVPPPPPTDQERWRREAKQWEDRYNQVADQLTVQAAALTQAENALQMSQITATQMALQTPSAHIEVVNVLKYLGECLQSSESIARFRQYLRDCRLLVTKLRNISDKASDDRFSLIQLNLATLKGFTDEIGAEFLAPIIIGIEANMKARRQNLKNDQQFYEDLAKNLDRLEQVVLGMQKICGDVGKDSEDPLAQWQQYAATFRSELLQHCHAIGKPVHLTFKSTHALTGKDIELFDRLTKALISRAVNQGIEAKAMRIAAGKSENGNVLVNIERRGSYYIVQVTDDGLGIGLEPLYRKGIEWGLIEKADIPMDPDKIVEFLLSPKIFAEAGPRLSHLPAIKSEVEAHGGFLRLEGSSDKKGTKFVFDWLVLEQSEHPIDDSHAA